MLDAKLPGSLPVVVRVDARGLDSNGPARAIQAVGIYRFAGLNTPIWSPRRADLTQT